MVSLWGRNLDGPAPEMHPNIALGLLDPPRGNGWRHPWGFRVAAPHLRRVGGRGKSSAGCPGCYILAVPVPVPDWFLVPIAISWSQRSVASEFALVMVCSGPVASVSNGKSSSCLAGADEGLPRREIASGAAYTLLLGDVVSPQPVRGSGKRIF